jgi:hypothetical protein
MWAVLFLTLPTEPNAVRVRVWRSLEALGCTALRDGAYLLPRDQAGAFDPLVAEVQAHGGRATVLDLCARDAAQRAELLALFDRTEAYSRWCSEARALSGALVKLADSEARRRLRAVGYVLQDLRRTDHYPGSAAEPGEGELVDSRLALDAQFSRGEPVARAVHGIARLDIRGPQGRRWAARARPWVDRLACAWLMRRFRDRNARFVWLDDPARASRGALGFDDDGARFMHVGARVTFEVIAAAAVFDALYANPGATP